MNMPLPLSPAQHLDEQLQTAQRVTPHITVSPQSAHIGALISNINLQQTLSAAEVHTIRSALLRWKVVFFRDQHLSHEQQLAFSRQFGDLTPGHPVFGHVDGYPELYSIAKHRKANRHSGQAEQRQWTGWHADVTAAHNPPAASILRGVTIPPYGGDTQWTNLVAAYDALSKPLQTFLHSLRGEHRFSPPQGASATTEYLDLVRDNTLVSEHPLITVHPETGE